jgi:hypothetical protein
MYCHQGSPKITNERYVCTSTPKKGISFPAEQLIQKETNSIPFLLCNLYSRAEADTSQDAEDDTNIHHLDDILLDTVRTVMLTPGRCFNPLIEPPPAPTALSRLLPSDSLALIGDTSLVANLDGENEQRRLLAGDACAFGGGGGLAAAGLTGSAFPWLLSLDPSALGGVLTRNLCGVCRVATGDRAL